MTAKSATSNSNSCTNNTIRQTKLLSENIDFSFAYEKKTYFSYRNAENAFRNIIFRENGRYYYYL